MREANVSSNPVTRTIDPREPVSPRRTPSWSRSTRNPRFRRSSGPGPSCLLTSGNLSDGATTTCGMYAGPVRGVECCDGRSAGPLPLPTSRAGLQRHSAGTPQTHFLCNRECERGVGTGGESRNCGISSGVPLVSGRSLGGGVTVVVPVHSIWGGGRRRVARAPANSKFLKESKAGGWLVRTSWPDTRQQAKAAAHDAWGSDIGSTVSQRSDCSAGGATPGKDVAAFGLYPDRASVPLHKVAVGDLPLNRVDLLLGTWSQTIFKSYKSFWTLGSERAPEQLDGSRGCVLGGTSPMMDG